jgi:DNA invertase Pin-like site-specific DNA recombinase
MDKYVIAKYIRLSMEDSKYDSLSISSQRIAIQQYAEMLPEFVDAEFLEFVDNGYSGTNFERPAVQELLELVRNHKIDCLIVKDFSRFGRNMLETGYFVEQVFPLFHTRFISIAENFDSAQHIGSTGGLDLAFKGLINEFYSRDLSEKIKSAKYVRMNRGEYQSKNCFYGYQKSANGRLEIDEEAAEVVCLIFALAYKGKRTGEIIQTLYNMQIPTPGEYKAAKGFYGGDLSRSRNIWGVDTVLRVLRDERFTGAYIIGKRAVTKVGGHHVWLKDESEWIKIPDFNPAIIEKYIFEAVQGKLRHFKCDKYDRQYALRGKMFCGCCGHAMSRRNSNIAFVCDYTRIDKSAECSGLKIMENELEATLFSIISKQDELILNADSLPNNSTTAPKIAEQAEYKRQIQICLDEKRHLFEQLVLGEIDKEKYVECKADFDTKLSRLKSAYEALAAQIIQSKADCKTKAEMSKLAGNVLEEGKLSQQLADMLISKVLVYPGNRLEIQWKMKDFI